MVQSLNKAEQLYRIMSDQFELKSCLGLYTLVSDEAIHPLIAEREYARLFRNMVIEYDLLLLTTLERKGISLRT
jgi:hypothetical protein